VLLVYLSSDVAVLPPGKGSQNYRLDTARYSCSSQAARQSRVSARNLGYRAGTHKRTYSTRQDRQDKATINIIKPNETNDIEKQNIEKQIYKKQTNENNQDISGVEKPST